jgi:hypothetical protein
MLAAEPLVSVSVGVRSDLLLHKDEIEIRISVFKLHETLGLLSRRNSS